MRALKFQSPGGLDNLQLSDIPEPNALGANEIRIRVQASSLNGHDYNVAMGRLPVADGRLLLSDGAGVIEAVGTEVQDYTVGQTVVSTFFPDWLNGTAPLTNFSRTPGDGLDGHGAPLVVRPANWYTRVPLGWTALQAATLPTAGLTAWRALTIGGGIKPGAYVLILGTGGVSIFALQMAKCMGAKVIVTSSSDEKLERARACGADFTVNYRLHPEWGAEVLRLTGGRGVDLVVETAGPGTLPQSIIAARTGGHIVLVGVLTGISGAVPTAAIMGKQLCLHGITVGSKTDQIEMIEGLDAMDFVPMLDAEFELEDVANAYRHLESGKHFGKIVISI